jgi:lipopolysaccharide export system protein LptA
MRHAYWWCFTFCLTAPVVLALDVDKDQPVQVQADRIEANQQTGIVTYRGHVRFDKGDIGIQADKVEVRQKGEALDTIHATGAPVRFHQRGVPGREEMRGTAARVDYHAERREITLTGKVHLEQGGDVLEAATVQYRLDSGDIRAEGGIGQDRVQAQLTSRRLGSTKDAP